MSGNETTTPACAKQVGLPLNPSRRDGIDMNTLSAYAEQLKLPLEFTPPRPDGEYLQSVSVDPLGDHLVVLRSHRDWRPSPEDREALLALVNAVPGLIARVEAQAKAIEKVRAHLAAEMEPKPGENPDDAPGVREITAGRAMQVLRDATAPYIRLTRGST